MSVFISWSGERSRGLAEALQWFLPRVLQRLDIFMSAKDIPTGARWLHVLSEHLRQVNFGIICVTEDNLNAPWIYFEAGAISNAVQQTMVAPVLLDIDIERVEMPLSIFQMAMATRKEDLKRLVNSINETDKHVDQSILDETFQLYWNGFLRLVRDIPIPSLDEDYLARRRVDAPFVRPAQRDATILRPVISQSSFAPGSSSNLSLLHSRAPEDPSTVAPAVDVAQPSSQSKEKTADTSPESTDLNKHGNSAAVNIQPVARTTEQNESRVDVKQRSPKEPLVGANWVEVLPARRVATGVLREYQYKPKFEQPHRSRAKPPQPLPAFETAWKIITTRLQDNQLEFAFCPGGLADFVVGNLGIETRLLNWSGIPAERLFAQGVHKAREAIKSKAVDSFILALVVETNDRFCLPADCIRHDEPIGFVFIRDAVLEPDEKAVAFAPWLFNDKAGSVTALLRNSTRVKQPKPKITISKRRKSDNQIGKATSRAKRR